MKPKRRRLNIEGTVMERVTKKGTLMSDDVFLLADSFILVVTKASGCVLTPEQSDKLEQASHILLTLTLPNSF